MVNGHYLHLISIEDYGGSYFQNMNEYLAKCGNMLFLRLIKYSTVSICHCTWFHIHEYEAKYGIVMSFLQVTYPSKSLPIL